MATSSQPEAHLAISGPQEVSESPQAVTSRARWLTTTRFLIATNVLIFYAMLAHNVHIRGMENFLATPLFASFDSELLLKWGSDFGPLTLGGQYWRIITSKFLHGNFVHLALNMWLLWHMGTVLDQLLSRAQTLAIYLLTGAAAALLSLSWHPILISCGSSGAIYGQAGVLIPLFVLAKLDLPLHKKISTLFWIACMIGLLLGRPSGRINYASHLGGFLCGLVIGGLFAWTFRMPQAERAASQRRFLALTAGVLVVMFATVIWLRSDVVKHYREELALSKTHPTQIFMDVKGSPKLVDQIAKFS